MSNRPDLRNVEDVTDGAPEPRFETMKFFIAEEESTGGGHIWDTQRRGSLCGIEKRFPRQSHEEGLNDFEPWLKLNEPWICRLCLRSYRRITCQSAKS